MNATTYAPRKTSHGFHLIMTILTAGLWAPIWFFAAVNATRSKKVKTFVPQQVPVYYPYPQPIVHQRPPYAPQYAPQYTPRHSR